MCITAGFTLYKVFVSGVLNVKRTTETVYSKINEHFINFL